MYKYTINDAFKLAADIVSHTSRSIFLTGKAGTGKTTFLHHVKNNVDKNVIVAAPTGVAAINAGGVTLHSLLQLPFEPFIPDFEGKKKLDYHFKLRKSKIEMLRELDLLIIDEVSMLRADMLDAVDYMLRRYRNDLRPFGGVQVLFIGDMFQLPPVVQAQEWEQLKHYYPSPFFFHAQVLSDFDLLYIELKTIYRQQDQQFIGILNRIRNNCVTSQDLLILNHRYNPSFKLPENDRYVVLCTHNYKADKINKEELDRLKGKEFIYKGEINGDFSENSLPAERDLILKEGAQVMFVRNDAGEHRRYYNGKLATISRLSQDKIEVCFENGHLMELENETWSNVRYTLNPESGEIEEEVLGSFTQYPIRLAWAITIHKSQGLTFDRVVIDAGQAFAAGQVYVALSRCTTLDGIVLFSRITERSIATDPFAIEFARMEQDTILLTSILEQEKPHYCAEQLKKYFNWSPFVRTVHALHELSTEKKIPKQEEVLSMMAQLSVKTIEQQEFSRNFVRELDRILSSPNPNVNYLKERVQKAVIYFHRDVQDNILLPLKRHLDSLKKASKVKLYLRKSTELYQTLSHLLDRLQKVHYGETDLMEGIVFDTVQAEENQEDKTEEKGKAKRPQKGDSQRITLSLFNEGKNIKEIATERNLSVTTVESHLTGFVLIGEISINQLMPVEKTEYLLPILEKAAKDNLSFSEIKNSLPEEYTYMDIRAVLNHLKFLKKKD
ncbi:MAG: helix-turn-helix domain-containing protein [Prevotella sp.]|jgi:hypothetical protein|nr:helix-turn-helix domain-containing protein [Prevotella sp.]